MKKTLLTLIMIGIITGSFQEVFAIEDSSKNKKAKEISEVENKFDYINMQWWENFNDCLLDEYIERAVKYNHNLKIATLSTKEYYHAV